MGNNCLKKEIKKSERYQRQITNRQLLHINNYSQVPRRVCTAKQVYLINGKLVTKQCNSTVASLSVISTICVCTALNCATLNHQVRRTKNKRQRFCVFHLNMSSEVRGLYKHTAECEGDTVGSLLWRLISAYIFFGKLLNSGHRLFIKAEGFIKSVILQIHIQSGKTVTVAQITEYLTILVPDSIDCVVHLSPDVVDFCK